MIIGIKSLIPIKKNTQRLCMYALQEETESTGRGFVTNSETLWSFNNSTKLSEMFKLVNI